MEWTPETRAELEAAARVNDHVVVSFESERTIGDLINEALAEIDRQAARIEALDGAARRLLERWDGYGWGNHADAYYALAKSAAKDWEALRAALSPPTGEEP